MKYAHISAHSDWWCFPSYCNTSLICYFAGFHLTFSFNLSQVVGVAQAINKKCGDGGAFTEQDEKVTSWFHLK